MPTTTETIHLPAAIGAWIEDEARRAYPAEACGFLLGVLEGAQLTVRAARPAVNRATHDDRFHIDARQVHEALQAARREAVEVLGVYHSHPDGRPEPSATDERESWGSWLYLIVACAAGATTEARCWRAEQGRFEPVDVAGDRP